jgi:hypothetical protein
MRESVSFVAHVVTALQATERLVTAHAAEPDVGWLVREHGQASAAARGC